MKQMIFTVIFSVFALSNAFADFSYFNAKIASHALLLDTDKKTVSIEFEPVACNGVDSKAYFVQNGDDLVIGVVEILDNEVDCMPLPEGTTKSIELSLPEKTTFSKVEYAR